MHNRFLFFAGIIVVLILHSCVGESEYIGIYVAENNVTNADTLILNENNKYERKLYLKSSNELILIQEGSWKYENGNLTLDEFFIDLDKEYSENNNFKSSYICSVFKISKIANRITFNYGYFNEDKFTYYRQ